MGLILGQIFAIFLHWRASKQKNPYLRYYYIILSMITWAGVGKMAAAHNLPFVMWLCIFNVVSIGITALLKGD